MPVADHSADKDSPGRDGSAQDSPRDSADDSSRGEDSGEKRRFWVQFARYSQLAFVLPAATVAGWLVGAGLDHWLHTSWLSIVGLLLGIAAGFVELVRTVSRDLG